jgi:hypothetical protein
MVVYEDYSTLDPYDSNAGWTFQTGSPSDLSVSDGDLTVSALVNVSRAHPDYPKARDTVVFKTEFPADTGGETYFVDLTIATPSTFFNTGYGLDDEEFYISSDSGFDSYDKALADLQSSTAKFIAYIFDGAADVFVYVDDEFLASLSVSAEPPYSISPDSDTQLNIRAHDEGHTKFSENLSPLRSTNTGEGPLPQPLPEPTTYAEGETYAQLVNPNDLTDVVEIPPSKLVGGKPTKEMSAVATWSLDVAPRDDIDIVERAGDRVGIYRTIDGSPVKLVEGYLFATPLSYGDETMVLEGEGWGILLKQDSAAPVYRDTLYTEAIRDYWASYVPAFDAEVIAPTPETVRDETLYDTGAGDSFTDAALFPNIASTTPLVVDGAGGTVKLGQTCFTTEAESYDSSQLHRDITGNANYSGQAGIALENEGQYAEWKFTTEYDIPADQVALKVREEFSQDAGGLSAEIAWFIDGDEMETQRVDDKSSTNLSWFDYSGTGHSSILSAGEHTLRVELFDVTSSDGSEYRVDVVAPHDARYSYNFDNSLDANDALAGPELYPPELRLDVVDESFGANTSEADVTASFTDSDNGNGWYARNNANVPFLNSTDVSPLFDFEANKVYGTILELELAFSRYGTGAASTPAAGYKSTELTSFRLDVKTNDRRVIEGEKEFAGDSNLKNIQDLHEEGGMAFAVKHSTDTPEVVSFRPGDSSVQRDEEWLEEDVEVGIDLYDYWNAVTVRGGRGSGDAYNGEGEFSVDGQGRLVTSRSILLGDLSSIEQKVGRVRETRNYPRVKSQSPNSDPISELKTEREKLLQKGLDGLVFDIDIDVAARDLLPGMSYPIPQLQPTSYDTYQTCVVCEYDLANDSGSLSFGREESTEIATEENRRDERETRAAIGQNS